MELIHILPKGNLSSKPFQRYELYLADEILKDPEFYREHVRGTSGYKILDNSLNELGASVSLQQLSKAAEIILPDEVVYPDSIDPKESEELLYRCREEILQYENLCKLNKMVVVHAESWSEALSRATKYASMDGVDVLAFSKVTAEQWGCPSGDCETRYDGRTSLVYALKHSGEIKIPVHFLGFAGFNEFRKYKNVSRLVRSMDSRVFLEEVDLWHHRDNILSHVSLGSERAIEDIEKKIEYVRARYESYGLS